MTVHSAIAMIYTKGLIKLLMMGVIHGETAGFYA